MKKTLAFWRLSYEVSVFDTELEALPAAMAEVLKNSKAAATAVSIIKEIINSVLNADMAFVFIMTPITFIRDERQMRVN